MSKLRCFTVAGTVLLLITGCVEQKDSGVPIKQKDGTIEKVIIGDHKETADKGGVAIEQLPQKIVDEQSYDVDTVSGATITSDGIRDAVRKCLQDAS